MGTNGRETKEPFHPLHLNISVFLYLLLFVVSTSNSFESDVLLLSKVREIGNFQWISGGRGRLWEAMLPWLDKTDQIRSQSQSESMASHTASHGLPLSDSLAHGLPLFVMWSVWVNQGARPPMRVRSDSTRQSNAFGHEISQTGPRIALPCPV